MERDMLDTAKLEAEISKMMAETSKLMAETMTINRETRWYPLLIASGSGVALAGAVMGLVKLFI